MPILKHGARLRLPAGAGDVSLPILTYGQFLDVTPWNEWRSVELTGHVSYLAPGASPVATYAAALTGTFAP